jgi:hypothetical protein
MRIGAIADDERDALIGKGGAAINAPIKSASRRSMRLPSPMSAVRVSQPKPWGIKKLPA